jgi:phosphatidylethanolamine-binding protein (PEBP) family uncharacterized protein
MWSKMGTIAAVGVLMTGVLATPALAMTLSFSWQGDSRCSIKSPAFTLTDVPKGTKRLAFNMVDTNLRNFAPDGDVVAYRGNNTIPPAAFDYVGPCPPYGQPHNYTWTVQASDGKGHELATAVASRRFPPAPTR